MAAKVYGPTRRCSRCIRTRAIGLFRLEKSGFRDSWCRDCRLAYTKAHRERVKAEDGKFCGAIERGGEHREATFDQVAEALGVSRARAQQLEQSAFRKVRRGLERLFRDEIRRMNAHDLVTLLFRS